MRLGERRAGNVLDGDAGAKRFAALFLQRLALARRQGGEEIVEVCISRIQPMELLIGAPQKVRAAMPVPLLLAQKSQMQR